MRTLRFLNGPPDHTKITTVRRPHPIRPGDGPGWYGCIDAEHRWFWVRLMRPTASPMGPMGATHYLPPTTACLPWRV
jgi:hypothetical protein